MLFYSGRFLWKWSWACSFESMSWHTSIRVSTFCLVVYGLFFFKIYSLYLDIWFLSRRNLLILLIVSKIVSQVKFVIILRPLLYSSLYLLFFQRLCNFLTLIFLDKLISSNRGISVSIQIGNIYFLVKILVFYI